MAFKKHAQQYDLVVLGATGKRTCEHITDRFPTDLRWAVAGRSESKLQAVIDECKKLNPNRVQPAIELADSDSDASVTALVKKTYVLITAVGPYCMYGSGVFRACAQNGTHYIDCTGEFPWVARMIEEYEDAAKASGALMFPQMGLDSAPSDLCTWALARHVREKLGAQTRDVTIVFHDIKFTPSGGSLATLLAVFNHFSIREVQAAGKPYALSPVPRKPEGARPHESVFNKLFGTRTIQPFGTVTTSFASITDGSEVERTWGLLSSTPSRRDEFYGPNFTWAQYFRAESPLHGFFIHLALALGTFVIACIPPARELIKKFIYQPGQGASKESTAKERVEYRGIASPDNNGKTNDKAYCTAVYEGGTYYLTGMLLADGARTLLEEDTGLQGGIYTPACLGQSYIDRVSDSGFKLEVKTIQV
ncbi:short-chain dehydrogenase-like protein [Geosmithia morbida]|uniref:Short-chain dehydrogenase-like protein n=1 Tax=Geosmithia morbida TaxID=1094350 RepID=A0A9P4YT71_9HYPO|nr:short-chain dehydrogenase-like protein [Geosmithia morbida]KAF4121344.1 short-chain dehydrogenase-like protein [Geosmithia morbida]